MTTEPPMPELHELLERRAHNMHPAPMADAFDRAMRRAERRHRNRRIGTAVLALTVFAVAGTGLWVAFQPGSERHSPPASVPFPGPTSTIALPSAPVALAADPDGRTVWVAMPDALVFVITSTGEVHPGNLEAKYADVQGELTGIALQRSPLPGPGNGFVEDAWLSDDGGFVWRVPLESRGTAATEPVQRIDVGGPASGVAVGAGSVWVTVQEPEGGGQLVGIDPATERVTQTVDLPFTPSALVVVGDRVIVDLGPKAGLAAVYTA